MGVQTTPMSVYGHTVKEHLCVLFPGDKGSLDLCL